MADELYLLVTGIPRAGKTTLANPVQNTDLGFTLVPLDNIQPVPAS